MAEVKELIFQIDSDIVINVYKNSKNYLIEYDNAIEGNDCIIYFSSNNIYFPNNENTFKDKIIDKNSFEWYGTRISNGVKHIFVRDIKKQWYLTGINEALSTPELLLGFLIKETAGYNVITVGSSSGGYAAVLYGSQLNAKRIYSFNGQMELISLLKTSNKFLDPLIFEFYYNEAYKKYYDLIKFIEKPKNIFYFYSNRSTWDVSQFNHIKEKKINVISFVTSHHGIPFLKQNFKTLFNLNTNELVSLTEGKHLPLLFSIKLDGFFFAISKYFLLILRTLFPQFWKSNIKD